MSTHDAIFVGAGHNALVAAAYLARAGWDVLMLERNDRPGWVRAHGRADAPRLQARHVLLVAPSCASSSVRRSSSSGC